MRLSLIAAGIAVYSVTTAYTQEAPPKEFTLKLAEQEIVLIANTLRDRPYREVASLLNKIQLQINEQEAKASPKSVDDGAPEPEAK